MIALVGYLLWFKIKSSFTSQRVPTGSSAFTAWDLPHRRLHKKVESFQETSSSFSCMCLRSWDDGDGPRQWQHGREPVTSFPCQWVTQVLPLHMKGRACISMQTVSVQESTKKKKVYSGLMWNGCDMGNDSSTHTPDVLNWSRNSD